MIVFLDFEASSLSKKSFPIEVAWVFQDGLSRSSMIRPAADWTDWSSEAEAIHGISRERLEAEGVLPEQIAGEMMDVLSGHQLYASAPSWDGKWLSVLLRAAGFPRHALRLEKSDDAFLAAAREFMGAKFAEPQISALVEEIIRNSGAKASAVHRALPDALLELDRWNMVRKTAMERARV
ncbi:MAG: transcriptional regulator [Rhizobiaceae bacterium]|nr:transcriptional regulator [Rhizobiaceae bacterium]